MNPPTPLHNRILIIDDNPAIHDDFRKILGPVTQASAALDDLMADVFGSTTPGSVQSEFRIDSAYQGEEGLEMVLRAQADGQQYSMAFVDMRMPPGWDGVQTISRIWEEDTAIQIVICTAYSDYSWQEIVSRLGNPDRLLILKKPFDSVEVLQLAHALTSKWLMTRQAGRTVADLEKLVAAQTGELQKANSRLRQEMQELETARRALRDSGERLSRAFDACPLPIAILRCLDHGCVTVNRAYTDAAGLTVGEVTGCAPWKNTLRMEDPALLQMMGELAQGKAVSRQECLLLPREGPARAAYLWIEPFELESGPHLLAVVQDVEDQQRLEEQLRQSQKVEAIGQLAAGVAHDFNNLLTVILGHTSVQMLRTDQDEDLSMSLQEVRKAGERAAALTRQLLAFSRKQVMQKQPVSLSQVVQHVEGMLRRLLPEHIAFCLDLAPALPEVLADTGNLEQVIVNLVVNARDAMPSGGTLTLHTGTVQHHASDPLPPEARPGLFATLTVSDTGTGMSEETRLRLFEPFYTTKEIGKGTGMGLATVLGIVQQHEGWVEVATSHESGTTFRIHIPAAERMLPLPPAPVPVAVSPAGDRKVVLLVEDDATVRRLARGVLRRVGYQVLEAPDGPQARELWRSTPEPIDLLLTDMVMPGGMSGKDVATQFLLDRPGSRVLYSSGYSVDLFGEDLVLAEGCNYLPKPYLAQQLIDVVALACHGTVSPETAPPEKR